MILSDKKDMMRYVGLHPRFAAAFEFLAKTDLAAHPIESHVIDGKNIYANFSFGKGKTKHDARLEAHKVYIDIQYLIEGTEEIGWKELDHCMEIQNPYKEEKDVMFYADAPETWLKLVAGQFAIFFPEDAHAPVVSDDNVHKVVVKVLS
ncbi:MAG: YhcH/YjgK/YiaL family protein [Ignavibacteriales bacterium]|nr:YhcH/YjgK/YiaL family protein [Ignavibacteriales bacterium]